MNEVVFSGYGVEVIKRGGKYYIRYDGGHFAVQMVEHEISEENARKVQISKDVAHQVLLQLQKESGS